MKDPMFKRLTGSGNAARETRMSAQAGIWNFDGPSVDQALMGKVASAIEQYGPDGGDVYIDGSIGMVYRAFHTTLESRVERQPHKSALGKLITWDGRLDNRDELIPQLHNDLSDDQTDVAIVAAAFERWGTDCFRRLVGDWAVSIWKPKECELIFAVDYMAIRHIFYYPKKDRIWWSTDLSVLVLLSGDKFHVDDDYIAGYFANDPNAHLTPYREICEVPPGQFVRVYKRRVSVHRYWTFSPKSRIRYKTDTQYEEHFRDVFRQSVRRRLRSDSPILAELSGGLDSSSVVCMADTILTKEGTQTPRVDTLSLYDKTEPDGDDWIFFQKVEENRGRVGFHIDMSQVGSTPASLEYFEFVPMPGYFGAGRKIEDELADIVRDKGYRTVLSGIGGDEFMGGIPDPREQLADLILQFRFIKLADELLAWSLLKRKPWIKLLWQSLMILLPPWLRQYAVKEAKVEPWIEEDFAKRTRIPLLQLGSMRTFGLFLPTRRACMCGVLAMANKMAKWNPSRLQPVEVRYPYLDQDLIQFVLSIPANQLLRPGERRSLMRRALVGCVPKEILDRRTKQFQARTPVVALEKNVEELRVAFDAPISSSLGYINCSRFKETLQAVRNGKEVPLVRLLRTISLEFWLRDLVTRRLLESASSLSAVGLEETLEAKT